MAKKPTITTVASGYYGRQALNTNFENIRDQFDNTLSLDGSTPNAMNADFDLNGNDLLNAKDGEFTNSLTVKGVDVLDALGGSVGAATVFKTTNRFTGDGSTVAFTLSKTPAARANTDVFINGIYQQKDTYTVSGTTLTFTEAPPAVGFEVVIYEAIDVGSVDASSVTTSDGQDVQAKLDQAAYPTRAAFAADVAAGKLWAIGDVVRADGLSYLKVSGSSVISDLPGWEPSGDWNFAHFGADETGTISATSIFQAAIDAKASAGGGKIFGRGGATYRIDTSTITVQDGVHIIGDDNFMARTTATKKPPQLNIYTGRGSTATPAFVLRVSSGMSGWGVYYPEQVDKNMYDPVAAATVAAPIEYGYTISTPGGSYAADMLTIQDIMLTNSYLGLDLDRVGQARVSRVYGQPISIGMRCEQWRDMVYVENMHFWPFNAGVGTALFDWILENGTAFKIGNVDGGQFYQSFCYGYNKAIHLTDFGNGGPWITWTAGGVDYSRFPVVVDAAQHMTQFSNCCLIGTGGSTDCITTSLDVDSTDSARVMFENVTFWNAFNGAKISSATGHFAFNNCTGKRAVGAPASGNDLGQFLAINEGNGAMVYVNGGGIRSGTPIAEVSGTDNTFINGIAVPVGASDVTPTDFGDPAASGTWTYNGTAASAISSITGGVRIDLSAAASGDYARFTVPQSLKDEVGIFVLSFDIAGVSGSSGNLYPRITSSAKGTHFTALPNVAGVQWPNGGAHISVPFILPPFGGAVYFDWVLNSGDAVVDITNISISRANPHAASNSYLEMMLGSPRWVEYSALGMPLRFENGFRVAYAGNTPSAGTHAVGDTRINWSPVAGGSSRWRCVTAGTPGTWKVEATLAP